MGGFGARCLVVWVALSSVLGFGFGFWGFGILGVCPSLHKYYDPYLSSFLRIDIWCVAQRPLERVSQKAAREEAAAAAESSRKTGWLLTFTRYNT